MIIDFAVGLPLHQMRGTLHGIFFKNLQVLQPALELRK